ncbi:MAG TPA: molecular chaperone HtpG [Spirochaetia bacterium]|nr:molecular chaperone HtpG [Spirochaetia bacterium]
MSEHQEKGSISVQTENILPIIKKWLYSEHDIFLRELVSNAVDAITKLARLSDVGEYKGEVPEAKVSISINKPKKTITISDNGIGMTREEIKKYITQIAFSSAEEFIKKYKSGDEKSQIIGHFGLGFYSAYMVAEKVEIITRSYLENEQAVIWECEGNVDYVIKDGKREQTGTDIILHISKESEEYLDDFRIKQLVKKYCNFLPVVIEVNNTQANEKEALWVKQPSVLKDEDYLAFYEKLFPFQDKPLFWIHLNVDFPFHLQGILYFPKIRSDAELRKGEIKLFCRQVFVSDNISDIIPPFLTLLQGVIDSTDIPLNISRSYLQGDPRVKKISEHITRKIADKLTSMFKNEKDTYQKYWDDIHPFIKFGCMHDHDFYEKMKEAIIFRTTGGEYLTLDIYKEKYKSRIKDKVMYTSDARAQAAYVDLLKSQQIDVLLLDSLIDTHFIQFLEMNNKGTAFQRIDADIDEFLVNKDDKAKIIDPASNKTKDDTVKACFEEFLKTGELKDKLTVRLENLKSSTVSGMILLSEQTRRMQEMTSLMQGKVSDKKIDDHTLVVNTAHSLIGKIIDLSGKGEKEKAGRIVRQIYDLAMIQQRQFSGEELTAFISRSNELMNEIPV